MFHQTGNEGGALQLSVYHPFRGAWCFGGDLPQTGVSLAGGARRGAHGAALYCFAQERGKESGARCKHNYELGRGQGCAPTHLGG